LRGGGVAAATKDEEVAEPSVEPGVEPGTAGEVTTTLLPLRLCSLVVQNMAIAPNSSNLAGVSSNEKIDVILPESEGEQQGKIGM